MNRREFNTVAGILTTSTLFSQLDIKNLCGSDKKQRPNILLIMTDQQTADAMSNRIGNEYINTPNMDELAANGVSFINAFASNPICVPSRTSIFSGLYSHQSGIITNKDEKKYINDKTLGRLFKDAGYDTGYVGKWHMAYNPKEPNIHGFDFMRSIKNNGIDLEVPKGAAEFLSIKHENPFLLVTSFVNPHNICEWARGDVLPDGDVGIPPVDGEIPSASKNLLPMENEPDIMPLIKKSYHSNKMFPVGNFDEKKWRQYRWAYYRMIEKVDTLIGDVLQTLKKSDYYQNTIIVFISDHGDMQGSHGWNQKTVFYENSVRVPLIISGVDRKRSSRDMLVNIGIDILPTLCSFAGINTPNNLFGKNLNDLNENRDFIVVENKMVEGVVVDNQKPEPSGRMVRSKRYKYCIYDMGTKKESLVDLEKDPNETRNVVDDDNYQDVLKLHRNYLKQWSKDTGDSFLLPY